MRHIEYANFVIECQHLPTPEKPPSQRPLRELRLLALEAASCQGDRHVLPCAHPDEVSLELSEDRQNVEEYPAHRAAGSWPVLPMMRVNPQSISLVLFMGGLPVHFGLKEL